MKAHGTAWGHRLQYNKAHVLGILDNQGYRHTFGIHNAYCFSMATRFRRMHLYVALYAHCLSFMFLVWSVGSCMMQLRYCISSVPSVLCYIELDIICPPSTFMCFLWLTEQLAITSLHSVNLVLSTTETEWVYCVAWTNSLNVMQNNISLYPVNIDSLFLVSRWTFLLQDPQVITGLEFLVLWHSSFIRLHKNASQ